MQANRSKAEPNMIEDFDAFWAEYSNRERPKVKIRGELVDVPFDISLELAQRIEKADAQDAEALMGLIGELYGPDIMDRWTQAGMTTREYMLILAWSLMRARGVDVGFAEVADQLAQINPADLGKERPPAPAKPLEPIAKTKTRTTRSASTGRSSSPTSRVSTASTRKR
jgi:hypothetical protein